MTLVHLHEVCAEILKTGGCLVGELDDRRVEPTAVVRPHPLDPAAFERLEVWYTIGAHSHGAHVVERRDGQHVLASDEHVECASLPRDTVERAGALDAPAVSSRQTDRLPIGAELLNDLQGNG